MSQGRLYSPGELIGPYEVVRQVAVGASGVVYEAIPDPELRSDLRVRGIHRVAVKLAREEVLPTDRFARRVHIERMEREARTLMEFATRDHPNVVKVYDFGMENGLPYYAMELVDGPTLQAELERRPRIGEMLYVFGHLCGAVALMHELGICHRNIKPGNVLIRPEGGHPVLIDFGICLPPTGRRLTGPDELLGTLAYVSPEYAAYWLSAKDHRPYLAAPTDDVWALGILFYEILTGGVPWTAPPDRREDLMREICRRKIPHPCKVNPEVPQSLGDLAMQLLQKSPRKRPKNAFEVIKLAGEAGELAGNVITRVPERKPVTRGGRGKYTRSRAEELGRPVVLGTILVVGIVLGEAHHRSVVEHERSEQPVKQDFARPKASTEAATDPKMNAPAPACPAPVSLPSPDQDAVWSREDAPFYFGKGRPLPKHPFPRQMKGPCPYPYTEMIGYCWKRIEGVKRDGTRAPCPSVSVEIQGPEGPECYYPVEDEGEPNAAKRIQRDGGSE